MMSSPSKRSGTPLGQAPEENSVRFKLIRIDAIDDCDLRYRDIQIADVDQVIFADQIGGFEVVPFVRRIGLRISLESH